MVNRGAAAGQEIALRILPGAVKKPDSHGQKAEAVNGKDHPIGGLHYAGNPFNHISETRATTFAARDAADPGLKSPFGFVRISPDRRNAARIDAGHHIACA